MSMNWHQRQHGWTCSECSRFNSCDDFTCECQHEAERREEKRRHLVHRFRKHLRDECILRGPLGTHRYRARRYAGGQMRYRCEIDIDFGYAVEWWRIPGSTLTAFRIYFNA
jgi:hypothetical protein